MLTPSGGQARDGAWNSRRPWHRLLRLRWRRHKRGCCGDAIFTPCLLGAGLAVAALESFCLGICFAHVLALLGLAVVAVALAVVDLGRHVDPYLAGSAACCGRAGRGGGLGGLGGRGAALAGVAGAAGAGAAAGAAAGVAAAAFLSTPPWPRQAPFKVAPLKAVPSLHVALTVFADGSALAGAAAVCAAALKEKQDTRATSTRAFFTLDSPTNTKIRACCHGM